ncbi:MAG: aspartate aminotransferase family protein [Gammaproteobacteria bacterium]|nr:aspartate aminotransferase family protein [Gammaproteobacteria bacterium]
MSERRPPPPSEGDVNLSPRRGQWQAEHLDEATQQLLSEDARYFLHQSLSTPCVNALRGCDGPYLEDLQGNRILDFHGNSVHQVGFGHPRVIAAIEAQLHALPFCTRRYTNRVAVDLARKLVELAPGDLNKVLFAPGGTSAIGMALKLARVATGRFKTISMWDAFHGASLDAISISGEATFRQGIGPLLPGTEHAPPPDPLHCPFACGEQCSLRCAHYVEYMLEKEGDVAAVVAETVRSTPYIPPPEYWQIIRAACDKHGALLILDEIPHCLGRTGKMFTCEHYGVVPDMLVIGKGLGGGVLPLAALLARESLEVAGQHALGHYTHEKSPVACAAGLATLSVLEDEALLEHTTALGTHALQRLQGLAERHTCIADVRGLGLLLGVSLWHPAGAARAAELADAIMYRCLSDGLSFKTTMGSILTLTPPLTITRAQLDQAIDILDLALASPHP